MLISEIFYSIQGEGFRIGVPSVFVRFGGCNLRCRGFGGVAYIDGKEIKGCDSLYSVHPAFSGEWMDFSAIQVLQRIDGLTQGARDFDVVLTGGEPSLRFADADVLELICILRGREMWVESNGSVEFEFNEILKELNFTLSIKLAHSGESKQARFNKVATQNIIDNARSFVFKFVYEQASDEDEIMTILDELDFKEEPIIYLMPKGVDSKTIDKNMRSAVAICLKRGWRLSDRLHIRIWGDKRGV